jgi:hypothetical protein
LISANGGAALSIEERGTGMADPDRDLYEVLGILPSASQAEVTSAYRRRVRALHPDCGEDASEDPDRLSEVLAAFQVLRNPAQRAGYDAQRLRRPGGHAGAVRIPVRHIRADAPTTGAWLRAGPVHLDQGLGDGSRPVPSPTVRIVPSTDFFRLIDDLFRRWR